MPDIHQAASSELEAALRLIVQRPGVSRSELKRQVDALIRYARKSKLSLENCHVAADGEKLLTACLCVDSPGRISSLFLPNTLDDAHIALVVETLQAAGRAAAERNIIYIQIMLAGEDEQQRQICTAADFQFLAELVYLECDLTQPILADKTIRELQWQAYSKDSEPVFEDVIQKTYRDSFDCPALNGLRPVEDILKAHRATGKFEPRYWLVGLHEGRPIGLILLAYIQEKWAFEVVYMGVLPECRGQGWAGSLLAKGVELARDQALNRMTCTVDADNAPARRLYGRFGFEETYRRQAWIHLLNPACRGQ